MNKEIEELGKVICKCCLDSSNEFNMTCFCNEPYCTGLTSVAQEIIEAGYHKTIWHKVADGDLPPVGKLVLTAYKNVASLQYRIDYRTLEQSFDNVDELNFVWHSKLNANYRDLDEIIAWAELPKYEEQHNEH